MAVQVKERTLEEIKVKVSGIQTDLSKIIYLESALKETTFSYDIKRYIWGELARLYFARKMLEKAARAQANKASMDVIVKERVDDYILSGEYFARVGKIDTAEDMFTRASRDAREYEEKVKLARRNIFFSCARELEETGKRAGAVKFYEKLLKMDISAVEKAEIKEKLLKAYNGLGLFREAKMLGGL